MKLFIGLLFATLAFNGVLSLPARNPSDDAEIISAPRKVSTRNDDIDDDDDFNHFKGVIDTGSGYPFLQPNPSVIRVGFFDSFDDLFRRFSARLFPSTLFGGRTGSDDSDEDDNGGILFPKFPTENGNTTSTVKVIDGHKVEVNQTVYGDANSVFKVRIVNIRPVEGGEKIDETNDNDDSDTLKPVTSAPNNKNSNAETDDDSDERREPLEKRTNENEIQGNIDDPEHSIAKNENIVETTTTTATTTFETTETAAIDNTMLPTNEDINGAFVTDNSLEQEDAVAAAEELNANENTNNNGNGNNEFETNISEDDTSSSNNNNNNNDNVDNVENSKVEHTIENNEDTEEEANDNLNESSTINATNETEDNRESEGENDDNEGEDADIDVDVETVNSNVKHSKYAAIRNKERENDFSSDDEDANTAAVEMHPTFNDEWGSLNNELNNENNDLNNDIDVYDVEPIDLSNDIAVNDAADLPINPDAEFIDIYGVQHQANTMPKFEKLSLNYQPASEEEAVGEHDSSHISFK